jgi:hypothetical protein
MLSQTSNTATPSSGLIPSDPVGQRFTAIFSHIWHWLKKLDGEWKTETIYPLTPRLIWSHWQSKEITIGLRFGEFTRYALLDIDHGSAYHPANDPAALGEIRAALETIGIYRTLLVRSSESEGLHLYIPLPSTVASYGIAQAIKFALEDANLQIGPGQLESFPNCKTFQKGTPVNYNGHRLPLQQGSALLNSAGEVVTDDLSHFLDVWEMAADGNDKDELLEAIAAAKKRFQPVRAVTNKQQRCAQWKLDDEAVVNEGWTADAQTNEYLKVLARYGVVWQGLTDFDALTTWMVDKAINAPGYHQFCDHQDTITRRCKEWAKAAQKYYRPYLSYPPRLGNLWNQRDENNKQQTNGALERIQTAARALSDRVFTSVREFAQAIASAARCSLTTLYKHRRSWHPHSNSAEDGCNSPTESDSAALPTTITETPEKLKPLLSGLLHPLALKKVENTITGSKADQIVRESPLNHPQIAFGFDFGDRAAVNSESPHPQTHYQREECDDSASYSANRDKNSLIVQDIRPSG